jgi:hypothetical protein
MHPDPSTAFYLSQKNSKFYGVTNTTDNFCVSPYGERIRNWENYAMEAGRSRAVYLLTDN